MSAYEVAKFCRQCLRDPELRAVAQQDPGTALHRFDLTDTERELLLAGRVGDLYLQGCSAFLMSYLPRWNIFGLTVDSFSERMIAAGPRPGG